MTPRMRVAAVSTTALTILALVAVLALYQPWNKKQAQLIGTWNVVGQSSRPAIRSIVLIGHQEITGTIVLASSSSYDIELPLKQFQRVNEGGIVLTVIVPPQVARQWGFQAGSDPTLLYARFEVITTTTARITWLPAPPQGVRVKFRHLGDRQPAAHFVKAK